MKKSCIVLLSLMLVFLVSATSMAKYEKGDYKIFALGDSEELTKEKYEYLKNAGEITPTLLNKHTFFTSDIAGHEFSVFLSFYEDQLYEIYFLSKGYTATGYDTYLKNLMMDRIKPMFEGLYGEPTKDFGYPNFLTVRDGYIYYISKWNVSDNKEIALAVWVIDFEYRGEITITETKIKQQKEQDEEEAKRQKILDSSVDF